jgi:tetratricopeptide (TPR) repeat protein
MLANHDQPADDVATLFKAGSWDELEASLRQSVSQDTANARLTFRLANLLTLRGKYNEAQPYYEMSWLQRWPGALCLNNRGVSLIWGGEARAGLISLMEAQKEEPQLGPAFYNLAIVLDFFADAGGPLPSLMRDVCTDLWKESPPQNSVPKNVPPTEKPSTSPTVHPRSEAIACFRKAAAGAWPSYGVLEAPLLLWHSELPTGFGYELLREVTDVEAAQEQFEAGVDHIKSGRWQAGLNCLRMAAKLLPSIEARIIPWQMRATVALCREYRALARERRENGDSEGARNALEALVALLPGVPDRELVTEILLADINEYGERLRTQKPAADWEGLQTLVAAVGHSLQRYRQRFPAAGSDGHAAPAVEGSQTPHQPSHLERHLGQLCWDAWSQQIQHFLITGDYETALDLLERSETFWFAKDQLPEWRYRVYTAVGEHHYAKGIDAYQMNDLKEASKSFSEALAAAKEARNDELVSRCESRLTNLARTRAHREHADLEGKLAEGQYEEVAEHCSQQLGRHPEDAALRHLLDASLRNLMIQAEDAARLERWDLVITKVGVVLRCRPSYQRAQELLINARTGRVEILVAQARNAHVTGDVPAARTFCDQALAFDPRHSAALSLKRRIEILEAADWQEGIGAYNALYSQFCNALAVRDFDAAFKAAIQLYGADSGNELTVAACDWAFPCFVEKLRERLRRDRSDATLDALTEQLERLLSIRPAFTPALELRTDVARVRSTIDPERHAKAEALCEEANKALTEEQPEKVLECVTKVFTLGDPKSAVRAGGLRDHALQMMATMAADLIHDPAGTGIETADKLVAVLGKWQWPTTTQLRDELNQMRYRQTLRDRGRNPEEDRNKECLDLQQRVDNLMAKPKSALAELHQSTRRLFARFASIPDEQIETLRALHQGILQLPESRFARWRLQRWDRRHCVPALCARSEGR